MGKLLVSTLPSISVPSLLGIMQPSQEHSLALITTSQFQRHRALENQNLFLSWSANARRFRAQGNGSVRSRETSMKRAPRASQHAGLLFLFLVRVEGINVERVVTHDVWTSLGIRPILETGSVVEASAPPWLRSDGYARGSP
jgi:hypothetical protein